MAFSTRNVSFGFTSDQISRSNFKSESSSLTKEREHNLSGKFSSHLLARQLSEFKSKKSRSTSESRSKFPSSIGKLKSAISHAPSFRQSSQGQSNHLFNKDSNWWSKSQLHETDADSYRGSTYTGRNSFQTSVSRTGHNRGGLNHQSFGSRRSGFNAFGRFSSLPQKSYQDDNADCNPGSGCGRRTLKGLSSDSRDESLLKFTNDEGYVHMLNLDSEIQKSRGSHDQGSQTDSYQPSRMNHHDDDVAPHIVITNSMMNVNSQRPNQANTPLMFYSNTTSQTPSAMSNQPSTPLNTYYNNIFSNKITLTRPTLVSNKPSTTINQSSYTNRSNVQLTSQQRLSNSSNPQSKMSHTMYKEQSNIPSHTSYQHSFLNESTHTDRSHVPSHMNVTHSTINNGPVKSSNNISKYSKFITSTTPSNMTNKPSTAMHTSAYEGQGNMQPTPQIRPSNMSHRQSNMSYKNSLLNESTRNDRSYVPSHMNVTHSTTNNGPVKSSNNVSSYSRVALDAKTHGVGPSSHSVVQNKPSMYSSYASNGINNMSIQSSVMIKPTSTILDRQGQSQHFFNRDSRSGYSSSTATPIWEGDEGQSHQIFNGDSRSGYTSSIVTPTQTQPSRGLSTRSGDGTAFEKVPSYGASRSQLKQSVKSFTGPNNMSTQSSVKMNPKNTERGPANVGITRGVIENAVSRELSLESSLSHEDQDEGEESGDEEAGDEYDSAERK